MKKTPLIIYLLLFFSCSDRKMSINELKTASWSTLDKGLEYIEIKKGKPKKDSIQFNVLEVDAGNLTSKAQDFLFMDTTLISIVTAILKKSLPQSRHGYIKLNLNEFLKPKTATVMIFLKDDYDSTNVPKDSLILIQIPGVKNVRFISKEMAKQKFLGNDSHEDWNKVLDFNPLSMSFEADIDTDIADKKYFEEFKGKIKDRILYVLDVEIPSAFVSSIKQTIIYYLEYTHN